jgi:spermidine synthase
LLIGVVKKKVKSFYQEIKIHESTHYGKVLILDDCLQLTERDAPHYNEMLAHVPMMEYLANKGPESDQLKVLVLGGGDGYVVSELLKYPFIQSIDHVELDEEVTNVSKKYFPWAKDLWQDERVNLIITDGAAFVKEKASHADNYYNVIIQDASDPFFMEPDGTFKILPSHVLYTGTHFEMMHKLLQPMKGVLMFQAETYNIPSNLQEIKKWKSTLSNIGFERVRYGSIAIGTYPTGQIGFMVAHASKNEQEEMECKDTITCEDAKNATDAMNTMEWLDWNAIGQHFKALPDKTKYYHPRVHRR